MEPEGIEMSTPVHGDGSDRRKEGQWLGGRGVSPRIRASQKCS